MKISSSQNGSAFFIILIAIAMFAALSYAVFQGGRSSQASLSADQARLAAQEIIQYADSTAKAVQKLRLDGCSQIQISYDSPGSATYDNASAPADGTCDILSLSGGKINTAALSENFFDIAQSAQPFYKNWFVTGASCIPGIGTGDATCAADTEADLIMILPWLKQDVCMAINKILVADETIPLDVGDAYDTAAPYTGAYTAADRINSASNQMNRAAALCFQGSTNPAGGYHFYSVLIAR